MAFEPIYTAVITGYKRIETFGYLIFQKRLEMELNLGTVADAIGIASVRLSALENEQFSPTDKEIKALAKYLNLDYQKLANAPLK